MCSANIVSLCKTDVVLVLIFLYSFIRSLKDNDAMKTYYQVRLGEIPAAASCESNIHTCSVEL